MVSQMDSCFSAVGVDGSLKMIDKAKSLDKISKYANKNAVFNKLVYWELNLINVQRETFNQEKWNKIEPMINEFWEKVENFRTMPIEDNIKKFKFIDDND